MTAPNPDDRPETMLRRVDFDTSPEPVTNADEFDTDKLPVQQYLVLEVLAARYRTGEVTWTFPTRVRWALLHLAELGLIGYKSGVAPRTYLAWLTEAGKASAMSETYELPEPDLWQYGRRDPDEGPDGVMIFVGRPGYISPRYVRRPMRAVGPWVPVPTTKETPA